jgi:hypothetical protein
MVKEAFHRLVISEMKGDNFDSIFGLNVGVENAFWFNDYIGTLLTEAVATGEVHLDVVQSLPAYFVPKCLGNSFRCAGNAPCSLTNKDNALICHAILHPSDV